MSRETNQPPMQGVQLRCIRCGGHCTHVSIPAGLRVVPLIQVSRSEQDGFTYARCTDHRCFAWTRYELVALEGEKSALADAA